MLAITLTAFGCVALTPAASAQDYLGGYLDNIAQRRQLQHMQDSARVRAKKQEVVQPAEDENIRSQEPGESTRPPRDGRRDATPAIRDLSQFTFTPSPDVSREMHAAIAAVLADEATPVTARRPTLERLSAALGEHPEFRALLARQLGGGRDSIQKGLENGALQKAFARQLERHAYSAYNAVDVNSAYAVYIRSLLDGEAEDSAAFAAQRGLMLAAVAASRGTGETSDDAQKQEFAEVIGALMMLSRAAWTRATTESERALVIAGNTSVADRLGLR